MTGGLFKAALAADIFEPHLAILDTEVVVQNVGRAGQASWPAHDRNAFPHASGISSRFRRLAQIEVDIIRDRKIEPPITVVTDEGTSRSPLCTGSSHSRGLGNLA